MEKNILNKKVTVTMRDSSGKPMTKRNLLLWALNVPTINAFTAIDSQKIKAFLQKWKGYIPS